MPSLVEGGEVGSLEGRVAEGGPDLLTGRGLLSFHAVPAAAAGGEGVNRKAAVNAATAVGESPVSNEAVGAKRAGHVRPWSMAGI